ncbi:hypothetical protein [Streptomyces canus]|uniref:hypothetical protein n=1 Tax=Streptomyces canus TaxID=58343 RepID=UPI0033B77653
MSWEEIEQALALIDRMTQNDLEDPEFTDTYSDALAKIMPKDTIASGRKMAAVSPPVRGSDITSGEVMSLCRFVGCRC